MLKTDKIKKPQASVFYVLDYLWGGFASLGVSAAIVAFWELGSLSFGEFLLPSPEATYVRACEILREFTKSQVDTTLWRTILGVGVSLIIGMTSGFIAGYFKTAMSLLKPLITALLAMPPIIWIVMALFWFGFGNASVLFTIIIIVTPLTFASAAVGMASVSKQAKELFDAYKLGIFKKIRYLYIPHLTSYVISSVSVAVASGVKIVVMAELLGASDGIGARIADARVMLDTLSVFAYVSLVIIFVALFEYLVVKPLEITFMPWIRNA